VLIKPPHLKLWIEEHCETISWREVTAAIVLVKLILAKVNAGFEV